MKKYKKIILTGIIIVLMLSTGFFFMKNKNKEYIDKVLSSKAYSYLSPAAKEFVKETYNNTGKIVLTEKNKEEDQSYLNPDYVEYLETGKASEYGYIPEPFIVDHSYKNDSITTKHGDSESNQKTALSYYNLRDDNYITNVYNQGSEGLCWAFASTTSLESHLAIKSNNQTKLTFSEKQIDYATTVSQNALDIGTNPYITSVSTVLGDNLNDGGNMLRYINGTAIGISPVKCQGKCSSGDNYNSNNSITDNKYWKYDYSFNSKLSPYEVANFDNTEYSVDEAFFFNALTNDDTEEVDSLVNLLKNQIVNNGSLYVGVAAYENLSIKYTPKDGEKAVNPDGKSLIYYIPNGWNPSPGINHAVSVIGWDDNYTHNVCLNKTKFEITDANKNSNTGEYSCSSGTLYTINGAWILQNSWGNSDQYIYLPYTSIKSSYSSISKVNNIDFDNAYRATAKDNEFTKGNTTEVLNKVKVFTTRYNQTIRVEYKESENKILVRTDYTTYNYGGTLLKTITAPYPGLYTIDLLDENINFDANTNKIKLSFIGNDSDYQYFASVHTNNVNENEKFINLTKIESTEESFLSKCNLTDNKCNSEPHAIDFDDNNADIISGTSRGLTSTDNLTFKVLDANGTDVTNKFHFFRNFAVSNYINTIMSYNSDNVELGNYTIEVYYDSTKYDEFEWNLTNHNNVMAGIGTEGNPYVIKTASDLSDLRNQNTMGNYYVLNNDLDLTYDTTNSKGLFYNSGAGWLPIDDFYGSFDGNNHVISGLYINRPKNVSEDPIGIFEVIYGTNSYIKNLIIKDSNINGNYDAGALAGKVSVTNGIAISNISVVGGKVNSSYYAGGLIGGIKSTNGVTENINCNMYNLYSNTIVGNEDTTFSGGIVGVIESSDKVLSATISDSISYSKVNGNGSKGSSAIGGIVADVSYLNEVNINNIISAGSYKTQATTRVGDIIGYGNNNNSINITNTRYINNVKGTLVNNTNENLDNNKFATLSNILYFDYTNNFNHYSYWTKPTINNINRFPMPNVLTSIFDFTENINDFELKISGTKNIYDLIVPNTDNAKNIEWTYDDEYLTISSSGVITPKKEGVTTLHITSLYDGYKDDIQVTISQMSTITFKSNTPADETKTQEVTINQDFNLAKNKFTYKGYAFKRWNTKADGTGTNYTDEQLIEGGITKDLILYAQWNKIQYKITFNGNGGISNTNETTHDWNLAYPSNGTITFGDMRFSKDNYILDNWNTDPNGTGTKFSANLNDSITFDDIPFDEQYKITLYAQWKLEKYTITFNSNQGTGEMADLELVKNASSNLPKNAFTRSGYTFKEWNTKANGTGTKYSDEESIFITKNTTLYAIWNPISYQIKYDSNGGTGNMNNSNLTYDVAFTLPANSFTKENEKFKEWNTDPNGTGTSYSNKANVTNLTTENNKIIILYAQWEEIKVELTATPNVIDYGEVYQNFENQIRKTVKIKNTGEVAVSLSITNPTGSGPFGSVSFENGKVLSPGAEYTVTLMAKPDGLYHDVPGTYNGTYKITGTNVDDSSQKTTVNIDASIKINKLPQSISYTTHVQSYGWQDYVSDGEMAGTQGEAKRLEGIKIKIDNPDYAGNVEYRTHIQSYGWEEEFKKNDEMSGTEGEAKRLEAIEIKLTGEIAEHYDIYYRVHAQTYGWLGWAKNGERSGTAGFAKRLEGIEIKLVKKGETFEEYGEKEPYIQKLIEYTTHVQSYGWQDYTYDGNMAGTSGEAKRLEGIKIRLSNQKYEGDIEYRTHIQKNGWETEFKKNGEMSGTEGEAKRLEAIEIRLTGEMAEHYDVYYRVHAQTYGWLNWAKNGERSGTAGLAKRLEGIEIVLVEKETTPPQRDNQNNELAYIAND